MTIEYFGSDVLIEQRFAPLRPVQVVEGPGRNITSNVLHVDDSGNPIYAWVIYQRALVVDGVHPWTGAPTNETHVWMPVGEADTVEEARIMAAQLAG